MTETGDLNPAFEAFSKRALRASSELELSLSLLRATLEATTDGVLVVSDKGLITSYNRRMAEIWRLPEGVLAAGKDVRSLGDAIRQLKDPITFEAKVRELYADPEAESFDVLEFLDGRIVERYSRPQKIGSRTVGRVWSFRDVTETRRAERELRESEARFRSLAEAAVDGILIHRNGIVLDANASLLRMFGYALDELLGNNVIDVIVAPEWKDVARRHMRAGSTARYEIEGLRKDGSRVVVEMSGRRTTFRGEPATVVAIHDISERKQAEAATLRVLEEHALRTAAEVAEQRAQLLAEASRILGTSFDYSTTLTSLARLAVPAFADFCTVSIRRADNIIVGAGIAHRDPLKESLLQEAGKLYVGRMDEGPAANPILKAMRYGEATLMPDITDELIDGLLLGEEHRRVVAELQLRSLVAVPLRVGDKIVGVLMLATSESGRRYGPDDLALAEELARRASLAVENARLFNAAEQATRDRDEMMSIVAHDLRNPLSTLSMAAQFMLETSSPDNSVDRRNLEVMRRAAERMNKLISDLLDVRRIESGRLAVEPRPEDIRGVLIEAVEMLRPLASSAGVQLLMTIEDGLPHVLVDVQRVQQVLSNLVGNAIKFTPAGGSIAVRADRITGAVRIAVSDTGPGIPADQLPHLFGRFWQGRRADRRGLGLGLAIAKAIIEAHGGRIWVESQLGSGATFFFTVSVASHSTSAAEASTVLVGSRALVENESPMVG